MNPVLRSFSAFAERPDEDDLHRTTGCNACARGLENLPKVCGPRAARSPARSGVGCEGRLDGVAHSTFSVGT